MQDFYLENLRDSNHDIAYSHLTRYHISWDSETAIAEEITPHTVEFPRINYQKCNGKKYRYVWGGDAQKPGDFINQLIKVDVVERKVDFWNQPHCYPGEPVFIPTPNATAEDEGVLLSVVLDTEKQQSFLLILDAQNLQELARVDLPHIIPLGFHGEYFAA